MEHLRSGDSVFRYDGEDFLVVLPATEVLQAEAIMQQLLGTWRDGTPLTPFRAGFAAAHPGEPATDTVARADAAQFEAKRSGRDRCCIAPQDALILLR